jgi:hypothetical protein
VASSLPAGSDGLIRLGGWSAFASVAATFLSLGLLVAALAAGEPFTTLNNIASVLEALVMVPMALALHRIFQPGAPGASSAAVVIGLIGMGAAAVLQALLAFGVLNQAQARDPILAARWGLIGVWLLINGWLAQRGRVLPRGLARFGLASGAGFLALAVTGFLSGGEPGPLFPLVSLAVLICYPTWAIWLGRVLSSGRVVLNLAAAPGSAG